MVMDDIDRKILKLLQDNARVSLKTIAENTFLSSPAVSARIEKLEKDGIIAGYHAQVDPMKLGYHLIAFINLDVTPEDKPKFYAYAESIPNVLECNCVTGEYSMLLKVAFQKSAKAVPLSPYGFYDLWFLRIIFYFFSQIPHVNHNSVGRKIQKRLIPDTFVQILQSEYFGRITHEQE